VVVYGDVNEYQQEADQRKTVRDNKNYRRDQAVALDAER
jgi:hypothetical protein